jgi:hypothetical protein
MLVNVTLGSAYIIIEKENGEIEARSNIINAKR